MRGAIGREMAVARVRPGSSELSPVLSRQPDRLVGPAPISAAADLAALSPGANAACGRRQP
jgi:hypothetical protein